MRPDEIGRQFTHLNEKIERVADRIDHVQIKALAVVLTLVAAAVGTFYFQVARIDVLESELNGVEADIEHIEQEPEDERGWLW